MLHRANLHWSCSKAKRTIYKDDYDYVAWSGCEINWNMPHSSALSRPPPPHRHIQTQKHNGLNYTNKHMSESEEIKGQALSEIKHYVISYWAPCAPFSAGSHRSNNSKFPACRKQTQTYEYLIFSKHTKLQYGCDHFCLPHHHLCISSAG